MYIYVYIYIYNAFMCVWCTYDYIYTYNVSKMLTKISGVSVSTPIQGK